MGGLSKVELESKLAEERELRMVVVAWGSQFDRAEKAEVELAVAKALLRDIRDCGEWHPSALEIDTYAGHGHNGENLKERLDAFLDPRYIITEAGKAALGEK